MLVETVCVCLESLSYRKIPASPTMLLLAILNNLIQSSFVLPFLKVKLASVAVLQSVPGGSSLQAFLPLAFKTPEIEL